MVQITILKKFIIVTLYQTLLMMLGNDNSNIHGIFTMSLTKFNNRK